MSFGRDGQSSDKRATSRITLILNTLMRHYCIRDDASDSGKEKFGADASNAVIMSMGLLTGINLPLGQEISIDLRVVPAPLL